MIAYSRPKARTQTASSATTKYTEHTQTHNNMTTAKLNEQANDMLVGLTIESTGDNWIKLNNGLIIYLADDEIEHLNSF